MKKEHHVFFLGGTGVHVAQAMVFACAHGLLSDSRLHLTVLDTDEADAIKKLKKTVEWYKHLHRQWEKMREDPIKKKHAGTRFSLFGADISLTDIPKFLKKVGEEGNEPNTLRKILTDMRVPRPAYAVLHGIMGDYSFHKEVESGLYANPAVGAYLLQLEMIRRYSTDETKKEDFRDAIKLSDQKEKVALCASSFGGTGVAAAEVMLIEFAPGGGWHQDQMELGAFLLQPYFRVKPGEANERWNAGEAENRHLEAKRHYKSRHDQRARFVAPAHTNPWVRGKYMETKQKNLPDFTEWMAAIQIAAWLQEENEEDTLKLSAKMMQACERFYELATIWTRRFERAHEHSPMFFEDFYRKCKNAECENPNRKDAKPCWHQKGCREILHNFLNAYFEWYLLSRTEDFTDADKMKNAIEEAMDPKKATKNDFEFDNTHVVHGKKLWRLAASEGCDGMEDLFSTLFYALGRME